MPTALLALDGIHKHYQMGCERVDALVDVSLSVRRGEMVAFVGASGSGKSTLMNILGCLDRPSSGTYRINGRDVAQLSENALAMVRNREIGFVFQNFQLLSRATARDNVAQPLMYRDMTTSERRERAMAALERVGLEDRALHLPNQLSGGQRQRVAIARAICGQPSILLADEPTGNLDSRTGGSILRLFEHLNREGHTILIVTHDDDVAARCGRVLSMGDGRLTSSRAWTGAKHARMA